MKEIYLIRHGQTAYNQLGIVQGSGVDAELNLYGRAQAEAFFAAYQSIAFDKIYTSKLIRTIQSVQPFIEAGVPVEHHTGLNEISWGHKEGKIIAQHDDNIFQAMLAAWREGQIDLAPEGGESPKQVLNRQKPVIDLILSRPEEQCILVCMHGRAIRILLTYLLGYGLHEMDRFKHDNLCLYRLHYDYQTTRFELLTANDTNHLRHLTSITDSLPPQANPMPYSSSN